MAFIETVQEIVSGYSFEVAAYRGLFGIRKGKRIEIKEEVTAERFSDLFAKLSQSLGSPIFVHSYYGFLWEKDGECLALNTVEKSYEVQVSTIFVLRKIPIGKKLPYAQYAQIEKGIQQVFGEQKLAVDPFVHYRGGQISCFGNNDETQCLLVLKPRSLAFYCFSKEPLGEGMMRMVPRYARTERISLQDGSTVREALRNCFAVPR